MRWLHGRIEVMVGHHQIIRLIVVPGLSQSISGPSGLQDSGIASNVKKKVIKAEHAGRVDEEIFCMRNGVAGHGHIGQMIVIKISPRAIMPLPVALPKAAIVVQ